MATKPLPHVDVRAIKPWAARWAAFCEGPYAVEAVESIYEEAKAEQERLEGYLRLIGNPVTAYSLPVECSWEARRIKEAMHVRFASIGVIDHLNGEEGFEDAIDAFESELWPDGEPL